MSGVPCLYRRPSGIYAVRIVVPIRLRPLVGRGEIHVSTSLRDIGAAKLVGLKIQSHWREKLMVLDIHRLASAGPLLHGEGLISICDAASALGLSESAILTELRNQGSDLFTQAQNWFGWGVTNLWDVERDHDGTFVFNDVERIGTQQNLSCTVRAYDPAVTIASLMTGKETVESVFRLPGSGAFWSVHDVTVPLAAWMAPKPVFERIRRHLSSATISGTGAPSATVTPVAMVSDAITVKHGHKKFSELFDLYRNHQSWGTDQRRRMQTEAQLFVELMDDPELSTIDVETIHEFAHRLRKLPTDIYQSRRRLGTTSLSDLMKIAEAEGLQLKTAKTAKGHVSKIAEILNYALSKGMIHANPASGFKRGLTRGKPLRAQDAREAFTSSELDLIFSQTWFASGSGEFSSNGLTNWRPHYYWLPLLALTTGGRLNELAQLYLDDVRQSEDGTWYLDFNLDGTDKLDADGGDPSSDKSLKTVNSLRVVPLHQVLIDVDLPGYVSALRKAGYERLFPELKRDPVKGYGKPAGSWFNGRLLGEKLQLERNGKKTFHSLRHNFVTNLERLNQPERVMAQLAGHERGKTQSATRYAKDRDAGELKATIDGLVFPCLSELGPFNAPAGIRAIKSALRRKIRDLKT